MGRKTKVGFFLTAAYNRTKKSTWGDVSSLKVMGRAVSMGGVVVGTYSYKTSMCRELRGKRQEAWTA